MCHTARPLFPAERYDGQLALTAPTPLACSASQVAAAGSVGCAVLVPVLSPFVPASMEAKGRR